MRAALVRGSKCRSEIPVARMKPRGEANTRFRYILYQDSRERSRIVRADGARTRGRIRPFSSFILALIIVLARTAVRANVYY